MTKPVITKRETKGSPLTYAELDANFQNLDDATITVTGDTGTIATDLNGSFKIAGGTALTSSVSGTTLTLNLDNTSVTAGSYTTANITVDAQGRITAATSGSAAGTVNTGAATKLAFYPSAGTTIDDTRLEYSYSAGSNNITMPSGDEFHLTSSYIYLESPGSAGQILIQAGGISLNIVGSGTCVSINKPLRSSQAAGTSTIETYENATSYANGATVNFSNFSGMILVNRQDTSGNVALWLLGSGAVLKLGDSTGSAVSGSFAHNSGINGYTWTNDTGGTITASFFCVKTRTSA